VNPAEYVADVLVSVQAVSRLGASTSRIVHSIRITYDVEELLRADRS
jgi:hypothetical protein